MVINIFNLGIHLYLALATDYDKMTKYKGFILLNIIISGFACAILLVSAIFVSRFLRIFYAGKAGSRISHRILFISVILSLSFIIKAVFPMLIREFHFADNW